MNKSGSMSSIDRLQVAMFQVLFRERVSEFGADMAFSSSIADSSNDNFGAILKRRPDLVEQWQMKYDKRRYERERAENESICFQS